MKADHTRQLIRHIHELISKKPEGLTLSEVFKYLTEKHGSATKKDIREAIRIGIDDGSLMYVQRLGQTMICQNFNRPIAISDRICIAPPGMSSDNCGIIDHKIIRIAPGVAFGNGIHPTTRMCIIALDELLKGTGKKINRAMDIGTGSGVLAIGALLLGAESCVATDIDACARSEAKANARFSGIESVRITIEDPETLSQEGQFDLVMANLRYPTLMNICEYIQKISKTQAYLIMSGMRPEEKKLVARQYSTGFKIIKEYEIAGWSALAMIKNYPPHYQY